jgi:hypothetical protein
MSMAPKPHSKSSNHGLAYRENHDEGGSLIVILAIIAFAFAASLLLNVDWDPASDFPTVAETLPSPDINSGVAPAPSTPPAAPPLTAPANP